MIHTDKTLTHDLRVLTNSQFITNYSLCMFQNLIFASANKNSFLYDCILFVFYFKS
jgi:hypothetical protein